MVQAQRHGSFGNPITGGHLAGTASNSPTMEEDLVDCRGTLLYGRQFVQSPPGP